MPTRNQSLVLAAAFVALASLAATAVGGEEAASVAALAKALPAAKVTLQQGLTASESTGRPISAKFELDEGHLQLSVYTAKGGAFHEVVVNHTTGAIAKSETISEADDLKAAIAQNVALAKVTQSLKAAVDAAETTHAGYRAISVAPDRKGGQAVAVVVLLKGAQTQSVTEPLK